MTYQWFTDLADVLRDSGIPCRLIDGWATRGRPPSVGPHDPSGVMTHHTASPLAATDAAELAVILKGNSEAPGPIYHLWTNRDCVTHVVAAGRCNHGGAGWVEHVAPGSVNANTHLLSHSVSNNGVGEYWQDDIVERMLDINAALCLAYGWPAQHSYFHWYSGQPAGNFKIDPAGPYKYGRYARGQSWDMPTWRGLVAARMAPAPPISTRAVITGTATEDDKMQCRFRHSDYANVFVLPDGTPESGGIDQCFSAMPMVVEPHTQTLASCVYRSWGITGTNPQDAVNKAEQAGYLLRLGGH